MSGLMPYCPNCGSPFKPGERYCFKCGAKIIPITEPQDIEDARAPEPVMQNEADQQDIQDDNYGTEDDYLREKYGKILNAEKKEYNDEKERRLYPPRQQERGYPDNPPDRYRRENEKFRAGQQYPPPPQGAYPVQTETYPQVPVQQPAAPPQVPERPKRNILSTFARLLEILVYLGFLAAAAVGIYLLWTFTQNIPDLNTLAP